MSSHACSCVSRTGPSHATVKLSSHVARSLRVAWNPTTGAHPHASPSARTIRTPWWTVSLVCSPMIPLPLSSLTPTPSHTPCCPPAPRHADVPPKEGRPRRALPRALSRAGSSPSRLARPRPRPAPRTAQTAGPRANAEGGRSRPLSQRCVHAPFELHAGEQNVLRLLGRPRPVLQP